MALRALSGADYHPVSMVGLGDVWRFRRRNYLSVWQAWSREHITAFIKELQRKNIPLYKYGVPLWITSNSSHPEARHYLHQVINPKLIQEVTE